MVKIKIIAIGKDKDRWVSEGSQHYLKLLSRWARVELDIIPSLKLSPSLSPDEIKKKEAAVLLTQMDKGVNIALTDSGRAMDSHTFARWMEKLPQTAGMINFIIGGPYGLDDDILAAADKTLSLSPLTFSHQVVRLVLLEQLYRAFSILCGTNYHK
ncbi:MAG: 23S rRNA (pseudouridine(1915)-N(3))-methyltransferase RlmH [candidate division Zixibacteria bacterium]|nr:23S rRNA (pseudouridine(1915)-N(3))-methyltransferase RlmH [candidate division Zixibacteria bacterium]